MGERHARVRRLCVATATGTVRLLTSARLSGVAGRLHVTAGPGDCTEMAFAPPGVDEVEVLTWLITTVYHLVMTRIELPRPVLLACHVGITRIEGDGLGGAAALRAQALLSHPDVRAIAAGSSSPLIVIMPDSLYAELRAEGLPGSDWIPVPTACAWVQCYPAQPLTGMDDLIYT